MSKEILGLDNGYNYTKTSEGVSILSTVEKGHDDYNADVLEIEINGVNYIVGENEGQYIVDANKFKTNEGKELLKITTLTAIAKSFPGETIIDTNIVAGLPIAYYSDQKEDLKKLLEELSGTSVKLSTSKKNQLVQVNKVLVFPQAAALVILKNKINESSLVVDIGGGTWDIAQFDGLKLIEKATYEKGMLILDSAIAQMLNSKYYTKFKTTDIQNIIERRYFTVDGTKKDINEIEEFIKDYVRKVIVNLKRDFDTTNIDNIYLTGGGSIALKEYILKYFPSASIEKDAQFTNANCFKKIGETEFNK